jgi:hypothetical protein
MGVGFPELSFVVNSVLGAVLGGAMAVIGHARIMYVPGMLVVGAVSGMIACWVLGFFLPALLMFAGGLQKKGKGAFRIWQNFFVTLVFLCWSASFFSWLVGVVVVIWLLQRTGNWH